MSAPVNNINASIHGMSFSAEYKTWQSIKTRCQSVSKYTRRGIKVCDEWMNSFEQFYQDMGNKPSPNHSLDRINNDGNYEPGNCRWATIKEQNNNKSNNNNLTYNGVTKTITQWGREYDLSTTCIRLRLNKGMTIEQALNTPSRKNTSQKVA